jgi:hypothetical protein
MSSGGKQLVVNPLERAVSTDIMRAQSFLAAAYNEVFRAWFDNNPGTDDVQAGAQYNPNTIAGTPSSARIFGGFIFAPVGGSSAAGVGPGSLEIYDPDATPSTDDSQYKHVVDPGTVTNSLTLTANSSGSLRLDVVELARVQPDNVIETDNRDIFNTITGLFSAATVNKVTDAQLQYRIRIGTAGSGFPGSVQGWLPIAVVSVPTGTSVWDTCTIWDVRPLVEDLLFSMTRAGRDMPLVRRCSATIDAATTASRSALTGQIEVELLDRHYGGIMQSSFPQGTGGGVGSGADALYVDLDDVANRSAGVSIPTSGLNFVYVCAPFGLPRWAKYTAGPNGRVPRSPRGLIVATTTAPDLAYGTPHAAIVLPPALQDSVNGQTVLTNRAACILSRVGTSASAPISGFVVGGLIAAGGTHYPGQPPSTVAVSVTFPLSPVTFTLTPNTDFPAHARAIWVRFDGAFQTFGSPITGFQVYAGVFSVTSATTPFPAYTNVILGQGGTGVPLLFAPVLSSGSSYVGSTYAASVVVKIPLPTYYEVIGVPGSSTPGNATQTNITWSPYFSSTGSDSSVTFLAGTNTQACRVVGWELLDAGN